MSLVSHIRVASPVILASLAFAGAAIAQDKAPAVPADQAAPDKQAAPEKALASEGILPLPDYTGDIWTRSRLSGDWGGARGDLARKGVMLDLDWTQVAQGVVSGGNRIDWDYGGSFDVAGTFDLYRMGVLPGALVTYRVESRYGESVNNDSGAILPVNTDAGFPITGQINEGIVTVTELNYTQFLSPKFALTAGKYQTLSGDPNEFASGRGRSQFMNCNLVINSALARTVPYSTVGGGVVWLPTDKITISSNFITTTDSSTTSGFQNTDDGWTWSTEADFQYRLGSLPGGCNVGGVYAFDGDFAHLGGKFQLIPDEGITIEKKSDSWALYFSGWQYLYTPDTAPEKVNVTDGRPDLRGIGLFARAAVADQDTNPVDWTLNGGIGGRGLIPSRENDSLGVGCFYNHLNEVRNIVQNRLDEATQGVEAFYNVAITPAVGLTFDIQWFDAAFKNINDATIVGVRFDVRF